MAVLREHFRPEFLNRIDDVVVFHPLGEEQLEHIIDMRLADLASMLTDRKITIELTDAARKAIFKAGYDRAYGARPLKRAIQRMVQDPLAVKILDGSVRHGDHVVVDAGKNAHLASLLASPRALSAELKYRMPMGPICRELSAIYGPILSSIRHCGHRALLPGSRGGRAGARQE